MNELAIAGKSPAAFFEDYLRLNVNDGAASPRTIKAYKEGLCGFLTWCRGAGAHPLAASRTDIQEYRTFLNARYKRSTARLKLLAVQLLFKALQAQGLRQDNPDPQIADILQRVEREQPGILDEIRRVREVYGRDPAWHEHIEMSALVPRIALLARLIERL